VGGTGEDLDVLSFTRFSNIKKLYVSIKNHKVNFKSKSYIKIKTNLSKKIIISNQILKEDIAWAVKIYPIFTTCGSSGDLSHHYRK